MNSAKLVLLLFALVLPWVANAEDLNALIVISQRTPRPALDPAVSGDFHTMLWPAEFDRSDNRLLSLLTGVDWRGESGDRTFRPGERGHGFVSVYYDSLVKRGYLARRAKWLAGIPVYAVSGPVGVGSANPNSLLLALGESSSTVFPIPYAGPWPDHGLLAFEADTWEEAKDIASRVNGRALVVELPNEKFPAPGNFYLLGRGWPNALGAELPVDPSTGVAGLVRARSSLTLLLHPEKFEWRPEPDAKDVPWRWFPYVRETGLLLLIAGMTLFAGVIGLATFAISLEKRGKVAAGMLVAAVTTPAILMVLGALERRFGLEFQAAWLLIAIAGVGAALGGLYLVIRRIFPGTHPLLTASLVGLLACVIWDPKWSFLSGLFGYNTSQSSPEALGIFVAYLTGVVAFSRGSNLAAAWFGRFAAVSVLMVGLSGSAWWAPDRVQATEYVAIALAAGEGWMRWPWLFILAFVPNTRTDVVRHGFAWSPLGCLTDARAVGAVNLFDYVAFAIYPGIWALGLIALYVIMFGSGFVMRQFRIVVLQDPRTKALGWATAALGAAGALNPALLPGAVFVAFGALITVFHAAVWSL